MYKVIHHLNRKGVYHLDIKPENFLIKKINEEFVFKVIDFGHTYTEQTDLRIYFVMILKFLNIVQKKSKK